MKRMVALCLVIVMLTGCSSGVSQAEYDKVVAERDKAVSELEVVQGSKISSTNSELANDMKPIFNCDIKFDEINKTSFSISEANGQKHGMAICSFDGKNAPLEFTRALLFTIIFNRIGVVDYTIGISIEGEEDATVITFKDGEPLPNLIAARYTAISKQPTDEKLAQDEYTKIVEQINAANGEIKIDVPEVSKNILICDNEYVKIEYLGCETDKYEDNIVFQVENKTAVELVFQSSSMSIDGASLGYIGGSDTIAAKSNGKVRFNPEEKLGTLTPSKISGKISVIDFGKTAIKGTHKEVSFVDVALR